MKLYSFSPADEPVQNWVFHTPEGDVNVPESRYASLICSRCGRFSHDAVFAIGFDDISPCMRSNRDIFASEEGLLCVNSRFRNLIQEMGFPGLTIKPVGKTGWNVIKVEPRFETRGDIYKIDQEDICSVCCRPQVTGGVHHLGQMLDLPKSETFFSTVADRQGSGGSDRDLLLTEGIAQALRKNKIKAGVLDELLPEEEYERLSWAWQRGEVIKFPKGAKIIL